MPIIKPQSPHAPAPEKPHLALLTETDGGAIAIPPGAVLILIEDARDLRKQFPMAIKSVHHKRMEFFCPCGNPSCTRRVVWNAKWDGLHPQSSQGGQQISVQKK